MAAGADRMLVFQLAHTTEADQLASLSDRLVYTQAKCWPVSVESADIRAVCNRFK